MSIEKNFLRVTNLNVCVTRFNIALSGSSIWLLIGMMNIPLYASLLKITGMIGSMFSGYIEKSLSHKDSIDLINYSLYSELALTLVYRAGAIVIAFRFDIGIGLIILGTLLQGIDDGFNNLYRERVMCAMYPEIKDRSRFRGNVKMLGSTAHTIGLGVNLAIMASGQLLSPSQIEVIKFILIIHGCTGIIDFYITYIERKFVLKLFKKDEE